MKYAGEFPVPKPAPVREHFYHTLECAGRKAVVLSFADQFSVIWGLGMIFP